MTIPKRLRDLIGYLKANSNLLHPGNHNKWGDPHSQYQHKYHYHTLTKQVVASIANYTKMASISLPKATSTMRWRYRFILEPQESGYMGHAFVDFYISIDSSGLVSNISYMWTDGDTIGLMSCLNLVYIVTETATGYKIDIYINPSKQYMKYRYACILALSEDAYGYNERSAIECITYFDYIPYCDISMLVGAVNIEKSITPGKPSGRTFVEDGMKLSNEWSPLAIGEPTSYICSGSEWYGIARTGNSVASHDYGGLNADWDLTLTSNRSARYATKLNLMNASAAVNVFAPADYTVYWICNNCGHTATIKCAGQVGVAIATGKYAGVIFNGTDYERLTPDTTLPSGPAYNLDVGLRKWRAALAKLQSGTNQIFNIGFHGDSISEGGISDATPANYLTKGFVGLIRDRLLALYGDTGTGFITPWFPHGAPFWEFAGTWTTNAIWGITKNCQQTSTNGSTATITFIGTGFNVLLIGGTSMGQLNWKIDGGANTIYDCYADGGALVELQITGLSVGQHTLVITKTADTKPIYVLGGYPTNAITKGIRVNNMSRWGTLSGNHLGDNTFVAGAEFGHWSPVLSCIALVVNDATGEPSPTDIAVYTSNIQQLITLGKATGDVLLINNGASPTVSANVLKPYADALLSLATTNNVAYMDLAEWWGGAIVANSSGYIHADNTHWSAAGHQDAANFLLNNLL